MKKIIVILSYLLFQLCPSYSVEQGRQPYKNFSYRDYSGHYQNWSVVQDKRGLIYVANMDGVLEYDGREWRTISTNGASVRSLDIDDQGRIWVGAQDEMGYLAPDSLSTLKYNSITYLLNGISKPIGLVRQVFATSNGIVFSSNSCIVRVNGFEVNVYAPQTYFHRTYHVQNRLFSVQPEVGLTFLSNDTLTLVPDGDKFAQMRIYAMLPFDDNRILIATQSDGLFLYDTRALEKQNTLEPYKVIYPFSTSDDSFFKNNWVYCGIPLNNDRFAFGTYRKGAAVIDKEGKVIQYIGKSQGVQDETVLYIAADNQDNLWLALNNGIAYSAIKASITSWDNQSGPQGVLQSVKRVDNTLYVSSNAGVFWLDDEKFKRVEGVLDLSWDISRVTTSDGKEFNMVATGNGIYTLKGGRGELIKNGGIPAFHVYQSKQHKDILYIGLYDGLGVAEFKKGQWEYLGRFEGVTDRIWDVIEDDQENLWFLLQNKGVVKAQVTTPQHLRLEGQEIFSQIAYNPPFDEDSRLISIGSSLRLSSPKGLYKFNSTINNFEPDSSLGVEFAGGNSGIRIYKLDDFDYLWYETYGQSNMRRINRSKVKDDGSFLTLPAELSGIPRMIFSSVDTDDEGITWITGTDGLFRFDPSVSMASIKVPKAIIREVTIGQNKLLFGGAYKKNCPDGYFSCIADLQENQVTPKAPHSSNNITFHFASPLFGQEGKIMFAYQLEGFDDGWSDWKSIRFKDYTNLPHGKYTFKVKAISIFDVESSVASFEFEVLKPWYKHSLSYIAIFVLMVITVMLAIRIKTHMLKASNLKLKKLIDERTAEILLQQHDILMKNEELTQQKEEIESQKDELFVKNKHTRSSIEYALTIQQAMLPPKSLFDKYFESFILFKPKDVVSGDFYWFAQVPKEDSTNKLLVAVVDCTGHGVPGAFMSMIGSRMLSEIVNERRIYDPAVILTTLNKMLNKVLNQKENDNFDGMDISLCSINQITRERYLISFCGANRPLAYHRKGATGISTLRGNRKSIGGLLPAIDKVFENQLLDLVVGDTLFLFTDGFSDQSNELGRKFTTARLYSFLHSNIDHPMDHLGNILGKSFKTYMGKSLQRDDVAVIGLRLK